MFPLLGMKRYTLSRCCAWHQAWHCNLFLAAPPRAEVTSQVARPDVSPDKPDTISMSVPHALQGWNSAPKQSAKGSALIAEPEGRPKRDVKINWTRRKMQGAAKWYGNWERWLGKCDIEKVRLLITQRSYYWPFTASFVRKYPSHPHSYSWYLPVALHIVKYAAR